MNTKWKPDLVCILGLSGSGKTTMVEELVKTNPKAYHIVKSCATRPMREGEINGKDYHFITENKFDEDYKKGLYVEVGGKYGGRYAVRYDEIDDEKINLLVTAKDGLDELFYSHLYNILAIWIDCDVVERFNRIKARNGLEYALKRIEKDGFRRDEEFKTCRYNVDSGKYNIEESVDKILWLLNYNGVGDFE